MGSHWFAAWAIRWSIQAGRTIVKGYKCRQPQRFVAPGDHLRSMTAQVFFSLIATPAKITPSAKFSALFAVWKTRADDKDLVARR